MALDEAPPFWWEKPGWQAWLLYPLSYIYGKTAARRMASAAGFSPDIPVICIGNFITGGAGKTPTALAFAKHARRRGMKPGILSRGYGGGISQATVVDPELHNSHDVGDEALLHAGQYVTVVSADRPKGAELLISKGCTLIIMDDGFQNPSLVKDYSLVVVDAKRGLGNGFAIPAGPMRVPFQDQLRHASGVLIIGDGQNGDQVVRRAARSGKPVFHGRINVIGKSKWAGQRVLAFAGIADPDKFYETLRAIDTKVIDRQSFGDHHVFTESDCQDLIARARRHKLLVVTTTKDKTRLVRMGKVQARFSKMVHEIPVELVLEDPVIFDRVLDKAVENANLRRLSKTG